MSLKAAVRWSGSFTYTHRYNTGLKLFVLTCFVRGSFNHTVILPSKVSVLWPCQSCETSSNMKIDWTKKLVLYVVLSTKRPNLLLNDVAILWASGSLYWRHASRSVNTQLLCKRKYDWMGDLEFDWFGFSQTRLFFVNFNTAKLGNESKTVKVELSISIQSRWVHIPLFLVY